MAIIEQLIGTLTSIAPLKLAESWDNVGLLIGDRRQSVQRVMTCLTITRSVVEEAVEDKADLIITHHPLPFKPLQRLTADSVTGDLILRLIRANVAVYSAHTAFDSASSGINATWCQLLQLVNVRPLNPIEGMAEEIGSGRFGDLPTSLPLGDFAEFVASQVRTRWCQMTGEPQMPVRRIGIACGSGGSFVNSAKRAGCDCLVTGEATFHTCLEAEALGVHLVLVGHYASERFAMERLAAELAAQWPQLSIWSSCREADPIRLWQESV